MFARITQPIATLLERLPFPGVSVGATMAVGAAAILVLAGGLRWGTFSAGGADSYGYVSQAALWLSADLVIEQPLARDAPWGNADWTFAPLGYRPGVDRGTIVPVYPAGLPLVMAAFQAVAGPRAVFLVVPLLAAASVVATAALAWRLFSPLAGVAAAWLLSSRSIFVYATMWPMSDVPAAAWWAISVALATGSGRASAIASGMAAGLAILTRPNLVPVVLAPTLYLAARLIGPDVNRRAAFNRFVAFAIPSGLGALGVAGIHTLLYGSPLRTGYGQVATVFSGSHASSWLADWLAHPLKYDIALVGLAALGAGATLIRPHRAGARRIALMLVAVVGLVLAPYAFYPPSPDWWYLRLLLTLYPPLAALGGIAIVLLAARMPHKWRTSAVTLVIAAFVVRGVGRAADWQAFDQREIEARYETVGRFLRETLPERAVFLAYQQSGSIRYYADRLTIRYSVIAPGSLDAVVRFVTDRGYRPYFVIEDPEVTPFRNRFRSRSDLGLLDWPPVAELRGPVRVQVFDPADRARWYAGDRLFPVRISPQAPR
jgi:hypothetical protein